MAMSTVTMAKYTAVVVWIIRYFPPSILMVLTPSLKGLVVFRRVSRTIVFVLSHKLTLIRPWKFRSRTFCKTRSCWTMHHIVSYTVSS